MSEHELQDVFQICSYLLSYPDREFLNTLPELEEELDYLKITAVKAELQQFFKKALELPTQELVAEYIHTFDFGKKTNLYITYMSNGEQRERGMDLLFLKNYYKLNGFEVTDKELPDYLPIMLEFASQVDRDTIKPIFERYFTNIKEIVDHLDSGQNLYGHLMKAIILGIEETGVKRSVRRSEEICLNNFYG